MRWLFSPGMPPYGLCSFSSVSWMYRQWGKMCIFEKADVHRRAGRVEKVKTFLEMLLSQAALRLGKYSKSSQRPEQGLCHSSSGLPHKACKAPWAVSSSWFGAVVGLGGQVKNLREDRWEEKGRKTGKTEQHFCRSGSHLVFWDNWPTGLLVQISLTTAF